MPNNTLHTSEILLTKTYQHFNSRDIDATLAAMHVDVDWPNGMEGGIEHGHEAVRNYWTRQWRIFNPQVEPVKFEMEEDGRINVAVHQVVYDMDGKLLIDQMIHHIFTIENGLIRNMEIKTKD
jgi:hypothetical protein